MSDPFVMPDELRRRAERVVGALPASPPATDALRQLHELQVAQVELDMQNEALADLQRRNGAMQRELGRFEQLYQQAPASYLALDRQGRVVCANQAAGAMLGACPERLSGQPFERYIAPADQPPWRRFLAVLGHGGGPAVLRCVLFEGLPGAGPVRIEANLDAGNGMLRMLVTGVNQLPGSPPVQGLAGHLADVLERERHRVAQEIHDEVAQNLLALRIDVSMLHCRTAARHDRLHQRAGKVLEHLDTTIRSARGIINELWPAVLDLGLEAAIDWQLSRFQKRTGIVCRLVVPDAAVYGGIGAAVGVLLFRMLEEGLANVHRHARASAVDVGLLRDGVWLVLSVADNGIGFAPERRGQQDGYGLAVIGWRLAALGGDARIEDSVAGRGCVLTLRVPAAALA